MRSWDGSHTLTTPTRRRSAPIREAGITRPARADRPDGSARLLLDHRARADGGPRLLGSRSRRARHPRRPVRPRRCDPLPDRRRPQVLRASGRRLAACAWLTRSTRNCWAAPASVSSQRRPRTHAQPGRHSESQRRERVRARPAQGMNMDHNRQDACSPPTEAAQWGLHGRATRHATHSCSGRTCWPARSSSSPAAAPASAAAMAYLLRAARRQRDDLRPARGEARGDGDGHRASMLGRTIGTHAMTIRDPEQVEALIAATCSASGASTRWSTTAAASSRRRRSTSASRAGTPSSTRT